MSYDKAAQISHPTAITFSPPPPYSMHDFYCVQNDNSAYIGSVNGVLRLDLKTDEIIKLYGGVVNIEHGIIPMLAIDNAVFFLEQINGTGNILAVDNVGKINRDFEYLANGELSSTAKLVSYDGTTLKYNLWQQLSYSMGGNWSWNVYKFSATARRVDCIGFMEAYTHGSEYNDTIDRFPNVQRAEEEIARTQENLEKGFNLPHSKEIQ